MEIRNIVSNEELDRAILKQQKIKFLKFGYKHLVIITMNNDVFVYGNNEFGEIGLGTNDFILETNDIVKLKFNFGYIKLLECGFYFTVIVNTLNQIYFTGTFFGYDLKRFTKFTKLIDFEENIKSIHCGIDFLLILTKENTIYGKGFNKYGQLGLPKDIQNLENFTKLNINLKVKDIKCGNLHTIILDNNNDIYTTGYNPFGQLGLNHDNHYVYEFTKVVLPFKVQKIFATCCNSYILCENNKLYGTGYNNNGQLGSGNYYKTINFVDIPLEKYCNNNIQIIKTFTEHYNCFLINDNIYVSGTGGIYKINSSTVFTKFDVKFSEFKFNYLVALKDTTFIVYHNYKINEEENNSLSNKLLQRLQNNNLVDINIYCKHFQN